MSMNLIDSQLREINILVIALKECYEELKAHEYSAYCELGTESIDLEKIEELLTKYENKT